uniref:Exocyst subunit Exo70 family protein n=1 Tax=Leersia perrieri TaxID=77586 RepID=A0A0D9X5I0_9ORYZ
MAVGEENCGGGWSSASSSSSPAATSSSCNSASSSSWGWGGDYYSNIGRWSGVHELHAIAHRIVRDGYMQGLIRAFDGAAADEPLLEMWFSQLDVEWVLLIHDDDNPGQDWFPLEDLMDRWILALLTMVQVLHNTQLELHSKRPTTVVGVRSAILLFMSRLLSTTTNSPNYVQEVVQFARFAEASILRMLAFVHVVALTALKDNQNHRAPEILLPGMLRMYACISEALPTVLTLFKQVSDLLAFGSGHESQLFDAMHHILLHKRKKLSNAIWGMMDKVKSSLLMDNCWQVSHEAAAASGVHETTKLMMNYVTLLWRNDDVLKFILQDYHFGMFVSDNEGFNSVVNLITDIISSLGHKLEEASLSIMDPGLRCIFLLNNWHLVLQRVESLDLPSWALIETCMAQRYIDIYLDVSWSPMLCHLFIENSSNSPQKNKLFGLWRYKSLERFELEFQRIYTEQKFWKIPDPMLRDRLRKAIIQKVVTHYSIYLEERPAKGMHNPPPTNTPEQLKELLEELFEGY